MEQENGTRIHYGQLSGGIMTLDEEESAHCVKVLRHREGDEISVMDGHGTLCRCRIIDASPKKVEAEVLNCEEGFGSHPYHLTMAVCPTKNIDRYEWFVEKATEIGVDVIAPVFGDRSERRILKTDRVRRIAVSAAKQSLKGAVPEVTEPVSVKEFIESADPEALKLICYCIDSESLRRSIVEVMDSLRRIVVLIGPEGDFSQEEVDLALSRGWVPVHLGESRLRTETAAVVAATAVYFRFQD